MDTKNLLQLDRELERLQRKPNLTAAETRRLETLIAQADGLGAMDRADAYFAKKRNAEFKETRQSITERPGIGYAAPIEPTRRQLADFGLFLQAIIAQKAPAGDKIGPLQGGRYYPRILNRATGMTGGTPSLGGFLADEAMEQAVFYKAFQTSALYRRCRQLPMTGRDSVLKIPAADSVDRSSTRFGGVVSYWVEQGATIPASYPKFYSCTLSLGKIVALMTVTQELRDDSEALGAFAQQALAEEISFRLDDAILAGDGSAGMPLGIINSGALIEQAKETGQSGDTLVGANFSKATRRMHPPSWPRASWFFNPDTLNEIFGSYLVTGEAAYPIAQGDSRAPSILWRPAVPSECCRTLGDSGDVLFADMSQYVVASKGGLQFAVSGEASQTLWQQDEVVLRMVMRVAGQPLWNAALTPDQGTTTQSPFVTIAERA